jgi:hypothetical protein
VKHQTVSPADVAGRTQLVLLSAVVAATSLLVIHFNHTDGHDFVNNVWAPARGLIAGLNPYDPATAAYVARFSVPVVAGLYTPTALVLHAPLVLAPAAVSATAMAVLNAALIWTGVLLLIPPTTFAGRLAAAVVGPLVLFSAPADHTIELGQLSGWAFAGLALFIASQRRDQSAVWLPALGAVLVALKPQSGVPFLAALALVGCWPILKRALAVLAATTVPVVGLVVMFAPDPVALARIAIDNVQLLSRLPPGNLANPDNLRIDAAGILAHLDGPVLGGIGWAAVVLVAATVLFALALRAGRDPRTPAATDPCVVSLLGLYVATCSYHLTYDQLLLYVGPLAAVGVVTAGRRSSGSSLALAAGAMVLLGAGLLFRPALRELLVDFGASSLLVHRAWVAGPTLVSLAVTAAALVARRYREVPWTLADGSAAARV